MAEVIGHFEQAVLVALVRLGSDAYGRAILNEVQKRLEREVSAGAVIRALNDAKSASDFLWRGLARPLKART